MTDDAITEAKAAEEQAQEDRERLESRGFLSLRQDVAQAATAIQAVDLDVIDVVIRQAERRREELVGTAKGDPAGIDLELRVFRVLRECRSELIKIAKAAEASASLRAGANGGKGLKDRLPKRGR